MTEVVLVIVIFLLILVIGGLLGFIAYTDKLNRTERKNLVKAIKAKNASELRDLEIAENTKITVDPQPQSDLIPESEASDEMWEKALEIERSEGEDGSR
jgi:hypothetical protein